MSPLPEVAADFADIYYYAAKLGFTPRDVDEWFVWECAAIFGLHRPDDDGGESGRSSADAAARSRGFIDAASERLLKAREAYRLDPENNPKPEAPAYRPEDLGMFGAGVVLPSAIRE